MTTFRASLALLLATVLGASLYFAQAQDKDGTGKAKAVLPEQIIPTEFRS